MTDRPGGEGLALTEFSHQELTLLMFALDGIDTPGRDEPREPSCEEACPVVEHIEQALGGRSLPPEKHLAQHINNHLREGMLECGMLDLMSKGAGDAPSEEDKAKMIEVGERLKNWTCSIRLEEAERRLLLGAFSRLPRSAWVSMPRAMWRLRKKLKK
jgi:hypothetical protein